MPSSASWSSTASDGRVELDRELAEDRCVEEQLDAVDGCERLAGVGRALEHQLAELDDALPAEPAEVDHAGQRVQRLAGADVAGRLLATDVLLAGLQRQHPAAAAVDVGRLTGDAAGHAADQLLGCGEESE